MSFEFVGCPKLPPSIAADLVRLDDARKTKPAEIDRPTYEKLYQVVYRAYGPQYEQSVKGNEPVQIGNIVKIDGIDCCLTSNDSEKLFASNSSIDYFETLYKVNQEAAKYVFTSKREAIWFNAVNLSEHNPESL